MTETRQIVRHLRPPRRRIWSRTVCRQRHGVVRTTTRWHQHGLSQSKHFQPAFLGFFFRRLGLASHRFPTVHNLNHHDMAKSDARFRSCHCRRTNVVVIRHACNALYGPSVLCPAIANKAIGAFTVPVSSVVIFGRHPALFEQLVTLHRHGLLAFSFGGEFDRSFERDADHVDDKIFGWVGRVDVNIEHTTDRDIVGRACDRDEANGGMKIVVKHSQRCGTAIG